ncbi:hypothetical protein [Coraliomargarita parva]|uniref:hypothetical protein n=1 Tax=Coraliomargarita parva TaxID=3014050 RepID=UPI0022B3A520|nr:hypothetical protein [Coraliomargarita parva]
MTATTTTADHAPTALLYGRTEGRIRRLGGFEKHHHVPDSHHDAAQSFVRRAGHPEVQAAAERLHADIRSLFGYKRREFDYSCEDGSALIKTPDFELEIRIDQSPADPKSYCLSTEVTRLHNESIAADPRFHQCFNHHCNRLRIEFPEAIDLEAKIDRIEDIDELAGCLDYAPDASEFELKLPALDLRIEVTASAMEFQLLTLANLAKLMEHSQKAFDILTAAGFSLRLS